MSKSSLNTESSLPSTENQSAGSSTPSLKVPMIPTTEEMKPTAGTSKSTSSLLPPSLPSTPTGTALPVTMGMTPQELAKAKADAERARWNAAYDAAQPSGRSLSVNDWEYQEIMRVYRFVFPVSWSKCFSVWMQELRIIATSRLK